MIEELDLPSEQTLPWLHDELRPLVRPAAPGAPAYRVYVWCGESTCPEDEPPFYWALVASGVGRFGLRAVLRHLAVRGWSEDFSILVESEV